MSQFKAIQSSEIDLERLFQEAEQTYFSEKMQQIGYEFQGSNISASFDAALPFKPAYTRGLITLNGEELLNADFPPREMLLAPWLPEKGLTMVYAERGIGKTWFGLNVAYAVASGGSFLHWQAPEPRRVVYLDGEMPAVSLQERYAAIVEKSPCQAHPDYFKLIAADLQGNGLPDLADPNAQGYLAGAIKDASLIVVDNLSTIARGLRENEADSWGPVQAWSLSLRAAGKSVFFIHHAGKSGGQRGTSRKEDVLDTVISLRRPPDYDASQGARFEVNFTKARGFHGIEAEPFEARFVNGEWFTSEIIRDNTDDELNTLREQGLSVREIASRTGMSKSSVDRRLKASGGAQI